jgi:O-antigen/teichoic acid export membrane protein
MLLGSFPNYIIGHALFSIDKQREVLKISGLMLFINIYFNFILIPKFGIIGVALTTVFTVAVTFIAYLRILKKYYKIMDIFKNWVKTTMLCIIIVSVGLFSRSVVPEIVTALCLISLYCFGIYIFKLISKQEITEFKLFLTQKGM